MDDEVRAKDYLCKLGQCKHQRRHWMVTVQLAHVGLDDEASESAFLGEMQMAWLNVEADPRVKYACGQIEQGEGGRLHGQCYLEFDASLRNQQVRKILDGFATHMRTTRTKCRDYCRKSSDEKSEKVSALPDIGEWRPERGDEQDHGRPGPKQRALAYVVQEGMTPEEIAKHDPEAYFTFHRSIVALHHALGRADDFL